VPQPAKVGGDLSYLTEAFCRKANVLDETWVAGLKTVEDSF